MERLKLKGLNSREYEHPFDREALKKLEAIPGVKTIFKKISELWDEKIDYINNAGSNLIVTKENLPKVYELLIQACSILDIKEIPPVYITSSGGKGNIGGYQINAYASGVQQPYIVINTRSIEALEDDELLCLIAHELAHIKSEHVLYYSLARIFEGSLVDIINSLSLGLGKIPAQTISIALDYWSRMSEFSADRASLLVTQDYKVNVRLQMKLAGLPANCNIERFEESFLKQAREFDKNNLAVVNKFLKVAMTIDKSHPWTVLRASEYLKWINSGEYEKILRRETIIEESSSKPQELLCPQCNAEISDNFKFCKNCGFNLQK